MIRRTQGMPDLGACGRRGILRCALYLTFATALVAASHTFLARPYKVPTESMEPAIMPGDLIVGERLSLMFGAVPERGQVLAFADPGGTGRTLVKRVVAVGGQVVDVRHGRVYVDGVPEDTASVGAVGGEDGDYPLVVPEGHVWLMGDNREHSRDSRHYGPVPLESVDTHIVLTYWPLRHARTH